MYAAFRNLRGITRDIRVIPKAYNCMGLNSSSQDKTASPSNKMSNQNDKKTVHFKCRDKMYPRDDVERFTVPDDKVPWSVPFPEYRPVNHTSPSVLRQPVWADVEVRESNDVDIKWNDMDGKINRRSHQQIYDVIDGVPRNPEGRTGLCGRGCLGRWGPNHAADPIVTRWKRGEKGEQVIDKNSGKPILQFVAVQRRDSGLWAIPGGMVDAGEQVSVTLKREFSEEAMNALDASPEEKNKIEEEIRDLFSKGIEVYQGYVDDPRNTDNSWMETVAFNFHDDTGHNVGRFKLNAGDDAVGVRWTDIHKNLNLFASHSDFIKKVADRHNSHWE